MNPSALQRFKAWLAAKLGRRYRPVLDIVDRLVTAFLVAFGASFIAADGFDAHQIVNLSVWQRAGLAGVAAALSLAKSLVATFVTGDPSLGALTSRTLRARREQTPHRPLHTVPVRRP